MGRSKLNQKGKLSPEDVVGAVAALKWVERVLGVVFYTRVPTSTTVLSFSSVCGASSILLVKSFPA